MPARDFRMQPALRMLALALCIAAATARCAQAQSAQPLPVPAATPVASPSPAAQSPTPRPLGLRFDTRASATFVDQASNGPGQSAPEAAGFIAGAPLAPNTPYDLFSSAPIVPGVAALGHLHSTISYGLPGLDLSLTAGMGYVRGSITNASYWGENLLPTLNPHLGYQSLPYAVTFPTHAGGDDATGVRLSILSGGIATADGKLSLRGGWFDLTQTDRFVFAQPALTNLNPALAYAPAESLSSGLAGSEVWQPYATALPLHGVDLVAKHGLASIEVTSAALPSLPGESARLTMGSLVVDHGEGTRFSGQYLRAATSGLPFTTTVPFGITPTFTQFPQGVLPTSTLSGQRQTIAGVRAAFHVLPAWGLDGVGEVGRAWYEAAPVVRPGTEGGGGYYHLGLTKTHGRVTAALDLYRMEPRYATMILPYGATENQWSVAFAWPGQWLKSNYQLIDNSVLGVNRQGYRLRYFIDKGPFEIRAEYTDLRQIERETIDSSTRSGFIDGFYLPQANDSATFGRQKRYGFWSAWHTKAGDVALDVVDDTLYRPFAADHPEDMVSYEVPQAVLTFSRRFSPSVTGALGIGRYAIKGAFAEPLDVSQRLFFAGAIVQQTPKASLLVSYRRTALGGTTTFPASPLAPNFTSSSLVVEQRYTL